MQNSQKDKQRGGAALEYILVSTFAAVVSLTALGFLGRVVEKQLEIMADKLSIDEDPGDIFPDNG